MYKFFKWFYNDDFLSKFFKDNVSKRYVLIFQKRRYVQKIFSMIFKCFKIYVQRNIFNYFFQCLFKKYVQRFFEIYIFFIYIQKNFSMILFLFKCIYKKNLKDLKNMYKLQSGNMYKIFPFLFFKISICRIRNFW